MLAQLYGDLAPPVQGQIFTLAHSTTAQRFAIPPAWRGQMVTISSYGSDVFVALGDATVKASTSKVATIVSEVIAPNWGSGFVVPAGASVPMPIPLSTGELTHISVVSTGTTGSFSMAVSSGNPSQGDKLNDQVLPVPLLHLDAGRRAYLNVDSGAITVASWRDLVNNYTFSEGTNKPDILDATATSSGMLRPAVSFVAGSSEKLQCTNAALAAALGGTNAFTVCISFRRTATGAAHTLFSVGTDATNNGRWDVTIDGSDDLVITRVTSGGASTTSTYATTVSAGMHTLVITFDGATPLAWLDGASVALTGTAAGDVGTPTKVTIGARAYNTSTVGQYAAAEISRVLVYSAALTGGQLDELRAFLRRSAGV